VAINNEGVQRDIRQKSEEKCLTPDEPYAIVVNAAMVLLITKNSALSPVYA
jgi:hypothetical protein